MIELTLATGTKIWLDRAHIVSVTGNDRAPGTLIRMVNGDQFAVTLEPEDVVSGWGVRR